MLLLSVNDIDLTAKSQSEQIHEKLIMMHQFIMIHLSSPIPVLVNKHADFDNTNMQSVAKGKPRLICAATVCSFAQIVNALSNI